MPALFVDNLTVLDFTFLHPLRGLVGESWIVDVELHGALDAQGMVFDFGDVKKTLKREIDRLADHRLLLPAALPGLEIVTLPDDNLRISYAGRDEHLLVECPPAAVLRVPAASIEPDGLGAFIAASLRNALPANVERLVVRLREERIDGAFYQYSHGLKKHAGACQRIAHGHRSRIEIEQDGLRSALLERRWADAFRDIYIGTSEDLVDATRDGHLRFAYRAGEGRYLLELHRRHVYLIDTDSTVEHIAQHIATALKRDNPQHRYRVKAYEGVAKGAIGTA